GGTGRPRRPARRRPGPRERSRHGRCARGRLLGDGLGAPAPGMGTGQARRLRRRPARRGPRSPRPGTAGRGAGTHRRTPRRRRRTPGTRPQLADPQARCARAPGRKRARVTRLTPTRLPRRYPCPSMSGPAERMRIRFTAIAAAAALLAACASAPPPAPVAPAPAPPARAAAGTAELAHANLTAASATLVSGRITLRAEAGGVRLSGEVGG